MDELEILKKDWKKDDKNYPKLSYNDIYKMILKKSSSIVKWIFIIGILEFVFMSSLSFFMKDTESLKRFDEYHADNIITPLLIISYLIVFYFLYRFFVNYRNISATDNAKTLMENILKTRRTVKQYVAVNLLMMVVSVFIVLGIKFNRDEQMISIIEKASANGELFKFYSGIIIITLLVLALVIGVLLLFYYLIYGILLKRLNKNYKELKKMEV